MHYSTRKGLQRSEGHSGAARSSALIPVEEADF
jgi:hypothetical protein